MFGKLIKNGEEINVEIGEKSEDTGINLSGADILFVCLGAPTQEKWIYDNRSRLTSVKLMLALGGSLDGYAGVVKRAPKIFISLGRD